MPPEGATERSALAAEIAHWRRAGSELSDLDMVASPGAWAALESYLGKSVRGSLRAVTARVVTDADQVSAALATAGDSGDLARVRLALLAMRQRYERAETVVDFYMDAINSRSLPRMGAVLRGLDSLAVDSMDRVLRPLGIEVPPVLSYLDKGIGASILRSGARLWDASVSPAAAIKITRHNLWRPTSLIHETGHQVAHLTGWTPELAAALYARLAPKSSVTAEAWRDWASEVAADVYAFALLGFAPVPALATVVDGTTQRVFRMPLGDPHPFSWVRVMFNAGLCRSWFGPGPWDDIARTWTARHDRRHAPAGVREIAEASVASLPEIVDVCTRMPMQAFGGVALSALADPRRVAPAELASFAARAGASLYTSSYFQRLEAMRVLAWTVLDGQRAASGGNGSGAAGSGAAASGTAARGVTPDRRMEHWLTRIGGDTSEVAAA